MIFGNLIFFLNLFIYRQEVFLSIPQIEYKITLMEHILNRA